MPTEQKRPRPSDAAIDALLDNPERTPDFDAKFGPEMAKSCIMRRGYDRVGELLDAIEAVEAKLDEVIDLIKAPRRITHDSKLQRCEELTQAFCRTAQTLGSADVWRRVHRLGGFIRVAMGAAVCAASLAGVRGFDLLIVLAVAIETLVCVGAGLLLSRTSVAGN